MYFKAEKTCVSGIVMKTETTLECVALGTGVKCLSNDKVDDNGLKVRDSHAEIICKRSFQRFLLQEILKCKRNLPSIVVNNHGWYKIIDCVEFFFYCSMPPCGDASMQDLEQNQTSNERVLNERKRQKFLETHHQDQNIVIRGRLNYSQIGALRTKPSRLDAVETLSMSCSDKLAKYNYLGLGGAFVSYHLGPVYMKMMVFGGTNDIFNLKRSLVQRIQMDLLAEYHTNIPKILTTLFVFPSLMDANGSKEKFSPTSISWCKSASPEYLVNGLKQGSNAKKINMKAVSRVSKLSMAKLFLETIELDTADYADLKRMAVGYQKAKSKLYETALKGWLQTGPQSFKVNTKPDIQNHGVDRFNSYRN